MEKKHQEESILNRWFFYFLFIFFEIWVVIFYGIFTDFSELASAPNALKENSTTFTSVVMRYYPFYQDVHVMIFIGFGFLMTFLKSYSWSSVAINYILGAWTIQISILLFGLWNCVFSGVWETIKLDLTYLINGDFAAASILIAMGGVLGKMTFIQYLVMATIQNIFYTMCLSIGTIKFQAVDMGGSMFIHTFGAYFGLSASLMMKKSIYLNNPKNSSNYNSNLFSMIGTIFLWMYWPSFNGALSFGNSQHRVIINTVISLTGSCFSVFILNSFIRNHKLLMEDILNATLAGGVIIGACSDLILQVWVCLLIGLGSGIISVLGYEYLGPWLKKKIGLSDVCGIHNLHGIPGFLGGIIGAIAAGTANESSYGESTLLLFPALATRTNSQQGGYQLAALGLVVGVAIFTGCFTGWLLSLSCFEQVYDPFNDKVIFVVDEAEFEIPHHHKMNTQYTLEVVDNNNNKKDVNKEKVKTFNTVEMNIQLDSVKSD